MKPHSSTLVTGLKGRYILIVVLITAVVLFASVFTFNRNLGDKLEQNTVNRILDIATSQRSLVLAHLEGMENELLHCALTMRDLSPLNRQEAKKNLQDIQQSGSFEWLCMTYTDGTAYCTGGTEHPPHSEDAERSIMQGKYHVAVHDGMVEITVPIHNDSKELVSVISGGYQTSKLTEYSGDFMRRYGGNLFVIQQDGTLLASSGDSRRVTGEWGHLSTFLDDASIMRGSKESIYSNMKLAIRDYTVVTYKGQKLLAAYSPVEVDGWYVLGVMPYSNVERDINVIKRDAYSISIRLMIAFTLIIGYLVFTNRRQLDELRQQQKEMRANAIRYKLISARNKDVILEFDLRKELMVHCENGGVLDSHELRGVNFLQNIIAKGIVHPEDAGILHEQSEAAAEGRGDIELELRAKLNTCDYQWYRLSMACVFDERGEPWRVVARANNIDQQKREAQLLEQRAVRDPLTKLYNKGGTRNKIERILAQNPDRCHALMIVDIDDFKQFNDSHGHLFGDQVLMGIADKMKSLFRSSDILGRVGGDEFLIFCRDIGSSSNAGCHAERMVNLLHEVGKELQPPVTTSCSIGVAVTPDNGVLYEELYKNADSALYEVKEHGKDGYRLFKVTGEAVLP